MPYANPPPLPPPTPFWGLGFRFDLIGWRFHDIADDIQDVWLIGVYLSAPFRWLGNSFYTARDLVWNAETTVRWIVQWVQGLLSGTVLIELWTSITWWFDQLYHNPDQFVHDALHRISYELYDIIVDARMWVRNKVLDVFPYLDDIQFSPSTWIRNLLTVTYGYAVNFLESPVSFVIDTVTFNFPELSEFIRSPTAYIEGKLAYKYPFLYNFFNAPIVTIVDWLTQQYPDLYDIIYSPRLWLRSRLADVLGYSDDTTQPFGITLLRGILGPISTLGERTIDTLSTIIVDAIMRFM